MPEHANVIPPRVQIATETQCSPGPRVRAGAAGISGADVPAATTVEHAATTITTDARYLTDMLTKATFNRYCLRVYMTNRLREDALQEIFARVEVTFAQQQASG